MTESPSALQERVRLCSRALSLTQPYGWGIIWAGKDIENRKPGFSHKSFRGDFLVHAAVSGTKAYRRAASTLIHDLTGFYAPGCNWAYSLPGAQARQRGLPDAAAVLFFGGVIGIARVVDLVPPGESGYRWHFPNEYGFVLQDVAPLPFVPCKGTLGFWSVQQRVRDALLDRLDSEHSFL